MIFLSLTKPVATAGGTYTEGVVGEPIHINPVLAQVTETDADLVQLVYGSLFSYDDVGKIRKSMVENFTLSDDGKVYTMRLWRGIRWHDGRELTAEDVLFTFRTIQDAAYKSSFRANWQGVDITKGEDDFTIIFSLKKPYFDFLENLTIGILPKHIWEQVPPEKFALADINLKPIGSGPYRVEDFKKDSTGKILSYELRAFPEYFDGAPFIQKIFFYFYGSEDELLDAYRRHEILGMSSVNHNKLSDVSNRKGSVVRDLSQPRVFAVFLNEKKNAALADDTVRRAIAYATDRDEIVRTVLETHADPAYSLFAPSMTSYSDVGAKYAFRFEEAVKILDDAGWKVGDDGVRAKGNTRIEFEIATPNWPDLVATADILKEQWNRVGVRVSVRVLDNISDAQRTIRSREYSALLYGLATTFDPDPFSFWHSSQTGESDHNFSMFEDKRADELLSSARETIDTQKRVEMYREFQDILAKKMPAIFLYSPKYLYVINEDVQGFSTSTINAPASRFQNVSKWYMDTKRVRK